MAITAGRVTGSGYFLYDQETLTLNQAILLYANADEGFLKRLGSTIPNAFSNEKIMVNGTVVRDPDVIIHPQKDVVTVKNPRGLEVVVVPPAFEAADFNLSLLDDGLLQIISAENGNTDGNIIPGGRLNISAGEIILDSIIQGESALFGLTATQGDITLGANGRIINPGGEYAAGGTVTLSAEAGNLLITSGGFVDVSAGSQGDAGKVSLFASQGSVAIDGQLYGGSDAGVGHGGSFFLDVENSANFSQINSWLAGGFDHEIYIRSRKGGIFVDADIRAERVTLMAAVASRFLP